MKVKINSSESHEEGNNKTPLWQLCKVSLSAEENMKEIRQFLTKLKPKSTYRIEKHAILEKILNFLFVIEMTIVDELINQQSQWRISQYLFVVFSIFKFVWFGEKRQKKLFNQDYIPQKTLKKHKSHNQNSQEFKVSQSVHSKSWPVIGHKFDWIIEWTAFGLGYFLYKKTQEHLYFPSQTKLILFTIMILFGQSQKQTHNSIKVSQLIVLTHNFNSFWVGLCCLILNNKFTIVLEKQQFTIREGSKLKNTVERVFGISVVLMLIIFTEESRRWFFIMVVVWILIKVIQNFDKECFTLKKKYKDEGVMAEIVQYH